MPVHRFDDKHPSAIIAYPINVNGLGSLTISGASAAITDGAGAAIDSTTFSGYTVTFVMSSGTDGIDYQIETSITLSDGQVWVHESKIKVVDN